MKHMTIKYVKKAMYIYIYLVTDQILFSVAQDTKCKNN